MKDRVKIEKVFYWLLGMTAAAIPMPGNQYSSITIILLFICWLFVNPFRQKLDLLKKNRFYFLVLTMPLVLAILGLIYTDDFQNGLRRCEILLPFLVIPLILFSTPIQKNTTRFALYCFGFGTLMASLFGVIKALYYRFNDLGNYFYYERFSELVDKHTTYFSLFLVVSILFLLNEILKSKIKWFLGLIIILFFLFVLYVTSTRISIIALAAGALIMVLIQVKYRIKWVGFIFALLILGFFALPNFQKRFDLNQTEAGTVNDYDFRELHWKSVFETIRHNSVLFGKGTGGNRDFLYDTYKKYKLTSAYQLEYNAHNQFLEIVLDYGLIGIIVFIFMIASLIFSFYKSKSSLSISLFCVFLVYFLTESLLQRQDGVVCFVLFVTLLTVKNIIASDENLLDSDVE